MMVVEDEKVAEFKVLGKFVYERREYFDFRPIVLFGVRIFDSQNGMQSDLKVFIPIYPGDKLTSVLDSRVLKWHKERFHWDSILPEAGNICLTCSQRYWIDRYYLSGLMRVLTGPENSILAFIETVMANQIPEAIQNYTSEDVSPLLYFEVQCRLVDTFKHYLDKTGFRVVNEPLQLVTALNTGLNALSTLGGGYSSCGDLCPLSADKAGLVTLRQLQIALTMNDPFLVSRCHLFIAACLTQKGFLKSAKRIILNEYKFVKSCPPGQDVKLENMCKGFWAKLKYSFEQSKLRNIRKSVEWHQSEMETLEVGLQCLSIQDKKE